jgi:hypothetical protein
VRRGRGRDAASSIEMFFLKSEKNGLCVATTCAKEKRSRIASLVDLSH